MYTRNDHNETEREKEISSKMMQKVFFFFLFEMTFCSIESLVLTSETIEVILSLLFSNEMLPPRHI